MPTSEHDGLPSQPRPVAARPLTGQVPRAAAPGPRVTRGVARPTSTQPRPSAPPPPTRAMPRPVSEAGARPPMQQLSGGPGGAALGRPTTAGVRRPLSSELRRRPLTRSVPRPPLPPGPPTERVAAPAPVSAAHLPVPPTIVARVVQLAADPSTEPVELARLLSKDPVMSAEVIGASNSSFHGARSKIATVDHACSFLGLRAVRNIVLCLGVRQLVPAGALGGLDLDAFWEASLRRAVAARALAARLGLAQPDELFALGLCQDLGLLLAVRRTPELGKRWSPAAPAAQRLAREDEVVAGGHPELGWRLLDAWSFPDELSLPIRHHHAPERCPQPHRRRAEVAAAADLLADVFSADDTKAALADAERGLSVLGVPASDLPATVDRVAADVREAAALLKVKVGEQPSYQALAATACQGMFELNLSYEDLTRQLRAALEEKDRLADELKKANAELARLNSELSCRAATDALTGLPNRRSFDEALARECGKQGKTVSLVMLDVDHFKKFNDQHGHPAGDEVLRAVSKTLQSCVRGTDVACRYGGEEFGIILPGTPAEGARAVAERIRNAIAGARLQIDGKWLSVTASLGGVTVVGAQEPGSVVTRADAALYSAKHSGRNRVSWSLT